MVQDLNPLVRVNHLQYMLKLSWHISLLQIIVSCFGQETKKERFRPFSQAAISTLPEPTRWKLHAVPFFR